MAYAVTTTRKKADRIAKAIEQAGVTSAPTIFRLDGGGYRVQHNDIGNDWLDAILVLLDAGCEITAKAVGDIANP